MEKIQVLVILTCMYTLHGEDAPSVPHVPRCKRPRSFSPPGLEIIIIARKTCEHLFLWE